MNFVKLESKGKQIFAKLPKTRRFLKGIYHRISYYVFSNKKIKSQGNIIRISPEDKYEYFFGYYDKSPWDINDRYIIALQVKNAHKTPDSTEEAKIVVFDTHNDNRMEIIGSTHCWNTQQSCMAQWLAPDFGEKIIYNDFRNNKYVAVVYNYKTKKEEKVYDAPIYDVSKDGKFALTLDFSRLHRLRKGYGYANMPETTKKEKCPDKPCIWKMDLVTGTITPIVKYTDLAKFETRDEMKGAEHKVNHIMISPNGKRFMVLHRWFKNNEKFTRLVTMNIDGSDMYNLSDDNFVSHCCWKNNTEILSFLRKNKIGDHYYLMKDKTHHYKKLWDKLNTDGHCTYSPNKKYVITDTYPNRNRLASVFLCKEDGSPRKLASVFAPFKYDNDVRCDLHPRWDHRNEKICIDSVHEGKKELYVIDAQVTEIEKYSEIKASVIIPCYNSSETIERTVKSIKNQVHRNIELLVINDGSNDDLESVIQNIDFGHIKLKFIEKQNTGVSDSRNVGLKNATGKYVFFLDSDDIISPNFIYKNIRDCEKNNFDCIMCNQERKLSDIEKGEKDVLSNEAVALNRESMLNYFMYNKERIVFASMIYKQKLISKLNLQFDANTKYGEDLEFAWIYLLNCKKIGKYDESMYGYSNNPKSAVNTVKWEKTDLPIAMGRVMAYLDNRNDEFRKAFKNYMLPRTYWTTAKTFAINSRKDYYARFIHSHAAKDNIKKLTKTAKNKPLKWSSSLFVINPWLFYYAVKLAYGIKIIQKIGARI